MSSQAPKPIRELARDGLPVRVWSGEDVLIEERAITQAIELLGASEIREELIEAVLTPDLHPGAGIPVGMVMDLSERAMPEMIGKDIGCGMSLGVIEGLSEHQLRERISEVSQRLREVFFAGGREIHTTSTQREAILREGVEGLLSTQPSGGSWELLPSAELLLSRAHPDKGPRVSQIPQALARWASVSGPDSQLGSLGGGNHFCEIGRVSRIYEGATAREWGLESGALVLFTHTGSLSIGAAIAAGFTERLPDAEQALTLISMGARFAHANRVAIGAAAVKALRESTGRDVGVAPVYDAPHNFIEREANGVVRHRKGATPAPGSDSEFPSGRPVLIPGSMGAPSYVMAGWGSEETLLSAPHGAGRALSRGAAAHRAAPELERLRVVTPADPAQLRREGRPDIAEQQLARVREEAPGAYKSIEAVIEATEAGGGARRVCELQPILTVKG